jgi:hypothetical protein
LILAASVVPRIPVLANAAHSFNSDEAVNALVIKHLLERGEVTFHNWDATYYGITEGLLAVPFVWLDGYTPLAFKLSALTGFLLLLVATSLLGRRLYGTSAGVAAAAVLAVFSPQLVLWSTLASGGYTLVIAWGTLSLLAFERLRTGPRPLPGWKLALFGAMLGFGLYIYELFLVYVALLAVYAATASSAWRFLRSASTEHRAAALRSLPGRLRAAALTAAGIAVGWAPKLALLFTGEAGTKKPFYALAGLDKLRANVKLLAASCAPGLFGTNPAGAPDLTPWVGEPWPLSRLLGILLLAFYAAAWLWGLKRTTHRIAGVFHRPPAELDAESLIVLLVPLTALLFVVSPNPQDVLSSRYLLPWLSSLPLLGGALLVRVGRRSRIAAAAVGLFVVAFPAAQIARAYQAQGYLGKDLRLLRREEPLEDVLRYLKSRGIRGAYGPYWVAYEATFLAGESILVAPFRDWDRYPEYTRRVQGMSDVAYVFADPASAVHRAFLESLEQTGKRYQVRRIGPYQVYTSSRRERLLPAYAFSPAAPLERPIARIAILSAPPETAPGRVLEVPVRVTNTGSEVWSAGGIGSGTYRVAVSYRWLGEDGAAVIAEGERTLLPRDVPPGGTVEVLARIPAPAQAGSYRLLVTLVQESVAWFDQAAGVAAVRPVRVVEAGLPSTTVPSD